MQAVELKKLLKTEPFSPIRLCLSDGRSIVVRHPDQVLVSQRHLFIGLATVERSSGSMSTPRSGDTLARDWVFVNLLQVTTVEPANGAARKPRSKN